MVYLVETDLKRRCKELGLTARHIANAIGDTPSTVGSRLNGFLPLSEEKRRLIEDLIAETKASKSAIEHAKKVGLLPEHRTAHQALAEQGERQA